MVKAIAGTWHNINTDERKNFFRFFFVSILLFISNMLNAQAGKDYFTIENYYKVKWGFADEFINLWKVNHYPLLKKAIEKGDVISLDAEKPKYTVGKIPGGILR